jgi:carboxynorspermidine decarboxylase
MLAGLKWMNLGGGHHITRADYRKDDLVALLAQIAERHGVEVYIEPGEAIALDAGILVGEILDTFDNAMPVAITDISATCHMPDVIEAPYRPAMLGEGDPRA